MIYLIPKTYFRFSQTIFFQISSFRNMYFLSLSTLSLYIPWIKWVKIIWKNDTNYNIPGIIVTFFQIYVLYHINSSLIWKKNDKRIWQIFPIKGGNIFPDSWSLIKGRKMTYWAKSIQKCSKFSITKDFWN